MELQIGDDTVKRCLELVSDAILEIKKDCIDRKDFKAAHERLELKLMELHYDTLGPHFSRVHSGAMVSPWMPILREALAKGDEYSIGRSVQAIVAGARQQAMREKLPPPRA